MVFQTDSGEKTLLVLQVKGEEIRSGVRKMTKTEGVTRDGVLSKVGKSLRGRLLGNDTGVKVVTVSSLRRGGKIGERG